MNVFVNLLNNIALLVSLSIVNGLITRRWRRGSPTYQVFAGILFGFVAVIGMMNALKLRPGIIFDGRSIIISISGLFGGPITAAVAAAIAAAYRALLIGGPGAIMGVSVITESACLGVAYYYLRRRHPWIVRPVHLLGFGILVHVGMLILTRTLPGAVSTEIFYQIAIPVIVIYPIATLLVCMMFLDQETQVQAEDALRLSEEKYRELVENANSIILRWGVDGTISFMNEFGLRFFGYREDELLGKSVLGTIVPDTESAGRDLVTMMRDITQNPDRYANNENENTRKDGTRMWIRWTNKPVMDAEGRLLEVFSVGSDITDRKLAEEALQRSAREIEDLYDNAPCGYHSLDKNGVFVRINDTELKWLGYSKEEVLGKKSFSDVIVPSDRERFAAEFARFKERGWVSDIEFEMVRKDGAVFRVLLNAVAIKDEQGNYIASRSTVLDITQYKQVEEEKDRLEEQLRQSQKIEAIGLLAGGVAHDLNNLLSPILGYSELMLQGEGLSDGHRRDLGEIAKAGGRARELVRQLMAFGRKQTLDVRPLDMNEIVNGFQPLLRRTLRENIRIELNLAQSVRTVNADRGQVEQVLMNLVVNAQDAMPGGGVLTIETADVVLDEDYTTAYPEVEPGSYALLTVSDTGMGMDKETLTRIFEPFFTTKEKGKGTGLGLATAHGIVRQHGGNIVAYSEPGRGSVFKVYLPSTDQKPVIDVVTTATRETAGGHETILLAEDEPAVRAMATSMLKSLGYHVIQDDTAEKCLSLAEKYDGRIDLLLTDVVMPEMSGKELYARLSQTRPGTKVLFMSGYAANVITGIGSAEDRIEFIQKPFTRQDLAKKIRQALLSTPPRVG